MGVRGGGSITRKETALEKWFGTTACGPEPSALPHLCQELTELLPVSLDKNRNDTLRDVIRNSCMCRMQALQGI